MRRSSRCKGLDAATLKQRLVDLDAYEVRSAGDVAVCAIWTRIRVSPRDGRKVTVGWALLHPLQHTGQHVGHIEMLRAAVEAEGERTGEEP